MNYHIAVVDDDASILDLLSVLLESEGYSPRTFETGTQALEGCLAEPPDAAIIDLMMPDMDGLELIHALRTNPQTAHLPILVCSAYYENLLENATELAQSGVILLRKPFHVQQLLDIVEEMVSAPRGLKRGKKLMGSTSTDQGRIVGFAA